MTSNPQRLLERRGQGLAATLLRAGCEERPSSESTRRTLIAMGVTTIVGSAAGEAAGGAGAVVSGLAGSTAAKVGASSISLAFAAKWVAIGGLSGLVAVGAATELAGPRPPEPSASALHLTIPLPASAVACERHASSQQPQRPPVAVDDGAPISFPPHTAVSPGSAHGAAERAPMGLEPNASRREPMQPPPVASPEASPLTRDRAMTPAAGETPPTPAAPSIAVPWRRERAVAARGTLVAAAEPPPDGDDPQPRVGGSEVTLRLNSQVVLIDGAWAAVKQHDAAAALRALSGYEQTFPSLDLHPEVLFLRVTAEDALGHKLGARAEAARIVALYPQSVQAKRARALLAQP